MGVPVNVLRRVPLLAAVDDDELAELAARFCDKSFDRGAPVVSKGSSGSGFFIIAEGEATVRQHGEIVGRLGKRDFFGEVALIDGGRRSRDIVAETNLRCWGISRKQFQSFVKQRPEVAWTLLEVLCARLRAAEAPPPRAVGRTRPRWLRAGARR